MSVLTEEAVVHLFQLLQRAQVKHLSTLPMRHVLGEKRVPPTPRFLPAKGNNWPFIKVSSTKYGTGIARSCSVSTPHLPELLINVCRRLCRSLRGGRLFKRRPPLR